MTVKDCEDALRALYMRDVSGSVDALTLWCLTNVNHSYDRELENYAPIVASNSAQLETVLEEYRTTRDCMAAKLDTHTATCHTEYQNQRVREPYLSPLTSTTGMTTF
ncbi:hypothetical protein RR46_06777 [Papilio xuthus]|uniref:Uncharacterized protein n=1 Tax=Papilio xuthus TaxID=66420 RepID=A0A194PSU7_PAPXU|nr:hypothetical protein RR46_06777 [Papilio xuthus]